MGFGELVLIAIILLVVGYGLGVPLWGIRAARRRAKEGRRSMVGVVWPSVHLVIYGAGAIYTISTGAQPIGPIIGILLNGIWLKVSMTANRAARVPAASASPPGTLGAG